MKPNPLLLLNLLLLTRSAYSRPSAQVEEDYGDEEEETAVYDMPEFISTSTDLHADTGRLLRLTCQVNNLNNVILMWLKDENQLALDGTLLRSADRDRMGVRNLERGQGQSLSIYHAEESDAGVYKCRIMAQSDQPEIEFRVSVGESYSAGRTGEEGEAEGVQDAGKGDSTPLASSLLLLSLSFLVALKWSTFAGCE